ncbi:ParB N-terminal domain-containing protein [Megasphaera sueciensis]|uniref:ParB N-terminal domain-containing protein n=1 Tax=Megasphaera sueciensis TaxID=349094 RepID=UPI003D02A8F3
MNKIKLTDIDANAINNVRKNQKKTMGTAEFKAMKDSIEKSGVVQPIILRLLKNIGMENTEKKYGIIDGNLRFQIVSKLYEETKDKKWSKIFAIIDDDDIDDRLIGLISNFSRVDMTEYEKGEIIDEFTKKPVTDENGKEIYMTGRNKGKVKTMSQKEIAVILGITPARVTQLHNVYKAGLEEKKDKPISNEGKYLIWGNDNTISFNQKEVEDNFVEAVDSILKHLKNLNEVEDSFKANESIKAIKDILSEVEMELKQNSAFQDAKKKEREERERKNKIEILDNQVTKKQEKMEAKKLQLKNIPVSKQAGRRKKLEDDIQTLDEKIKGMQLEKEQLL